jgi:hypothetical protein
LVILTSIDFTLTLRVSHNLVAMAAIDAVICEIGGEVEETFENRAWF